MSSTPENPGEVPQAPETLGLKPYSLKNSKEMTRKELKTMTIGELLAQRDEIDALLPPLTLKSFNAEQEVLLQYLRIKELQMEVSSIDANVPANQKAQVANSVAKTLSEITRLRNEIYNSEQFRMMEAALAKALKTLPPEAQQVFFEQYRKTAEEMADVGPQPIS